MKAVSWGFAALIAILCLSSCAAGETEPEEPFDVGIQANPVDQGGLSGTIVGLPAYERLVEDMETGRIPQSVNVLYDQMGSRPDVDITDEETIRRIYRELCRIEVAGKTNLSVTDCYHHVIFTLQDGTQVGFWFESEEILDCGGGLRYSVTGGSALWWQVLVFAAGLCAMIPIWNRQAKRFEYAAWEMRAVIDGGSSGLSAPALKILNESKESPKRMYVSALAIGVLVVACVGMGIMLVCFSATIFNPDPGMLVAGMFFILLGVVAAIPAVQWLKVAGMLKRRP